MYIPIFQNTNITKKTSCIKIVPTDCFACESHQENTTKQSNIIYVEKNKISKT